MTEQSQFLKIGLMHLRDLTTEEQYPQAPIVLALGAIGVQTTNNFLLLSYNDVNAMATEQKMIPSHWNLLMRLVHRLMNSKHAVKQWRGLTVGG